MRAVTSTCAVMMAAVEPLSVAVPETAPPIFIEGAMALAKPICSGTIRTCKSRAVKIPLANPITPFPINLLLPDRESSTTISPFIRSACCPPLKAARPVRVRGRGNFIPNIRVNNRVSRFVNRRLAFRKATVSVTVASISPVTCDRSRVMSMFCARYTLLPPVQSSPKSSLPDPCSGSFTIAQRISAGLTGSPCNLRCRLPLLM